MFIPFCTFILTTIVGAAALGSTKGKIININNQQQSKALWMAYRQGCVWVVGVGRLCDWGQRWHAGQVIAFIHGEIVPLPKWEPTVLVK